VAAGNNSEEEPTRTTALPLAIVGRLIKAQGMALFVHSLDPAALAALLGSTHTGLRTPQSRSAELPHERCGERGTSC
jgi:hypothetical protein